MEADMAVGENSTVSTSFPQTVGEEEFLLKGREPISSSHLVHHLQLVLIEE